MGQPISTRYAVRALRVSCPACRAPPFSTFHQILEPSPLRVVPPCPLFGSCGGCQYQFMPIREQRRLKRSHVAGVLARIGGFDAPEVLDVVGTDEVRAAHCARAARVYLYV